MKIMVLWRQEYVVKELLMKSSNTCLSRSKSDKTYLSNDTLEVLNHLLYKLNQIP